MSHYTVDCLPISEWSWKRSENMRDVVLFVAATIQQRFETVPGIMADIRANGADSRFLFGSKRDLFAYVTAYHADLFADLEAASVLSDTREAAIQAVMRLTSVPGLGCVKAGFVAQMLGFEVGCLDTHNLRRFGLKASDFKWGPNARPELIRAKVARYVDTCGEFGGSRGLWDSWCDYVALAWPNTWLDGAHVSAWHTKALGLDVA